MAKMKCKKCGRSAEIHLRQHNTAFCRHCFVFFVHRQVERTIERERMFRRDEPVLVAVSGGKDSLALWRILDELGFSTTGLHLSLGIGRYSQESQRLTREFAARRNRPLIVLDLAEEGPGLAVPRVAAGTNRPACSACGTMKRHFFDRVAVERGFPVLATGHNLDDEAARLLGNVLRWQTDYLARQRPVLEPVRPGFVRKVKPLYRCSEYEMAAYAFFTGIDYIIEECPNAAGATQLAHKDALNRLEAASPGTKRTFVEEFLRRAQPLFRRDEQGAPNACASCGMPSYGDLCSFCRLVAEVERKSGRRAAAGA